jgi:hypothetical protein
MTLFLVGGGYTAAAVLRAVSSPPSAVPGGRADAVQRPAACDERFGEARVVRRRSVDAGDQVVPDFAEFPRMFTPKDAVVVTFPATEDGRAEGAVAAACTEIPTVYVSTVALYGSTRDVSVATQTAPDADPRRLRAERLFQAAGAVILRAPAIYGPDRGVHQRIRAGLHRIPGDGSRFTSRIHVDDLAALLLGALCTHKIDRRWAGAVFPVGDATPCSHKEIARFVCETFSVPFPASVPLEEAPVTLRGDRRVDGRAACEAFGVALRYPSFRDGILPSSPP